MESKDICNVKIQKESDRTGKTGKILLNAFLKGPSPSVISYGTVDVEKSTGPSSGRGSGQSGNSSSTGGNSSSTGSNSNSTGGNESLHYSLLRASNSIKKICEANPPQNPQPSEDDSDSFKSGGGTYIVAVDLPDEGITKWKISFNRDVSDKNKSAAITAIKSKDFEAGYLLASKGIGTDGFAVMEVTTSIYDRADTKDRCPYIGNCQYGFDSGSEDTSEEDMTVCIAVAPIDAVKNKPDQDAVFKVVYDILGDISAGGSLKSTLSFLLSKDNFKPSDKELENASNDVSKYLHAMFKCVGNNTMYSDFKKIRDYVIKQISENNLAYSKKYSQDIDDYATLISSNDMLLTY